MTGVGTCSLVVCDPSADRVRLVDGVVAACALTHQGLSNGVALAQLQRATDACGIALVAVDDMSSTAILEAIAVLKQKGYTVLCYAQPAAGWTLGRQCRLLLAGASDVIDSSKSTFDVELREHITRLIDAEHERRGDAQQLKELMRTLGMVGDSDSITTVFRWILRVAPLSGLPVLLSGETGTGKELVARSIHRLDSRRANGPIVAINCGAISAGLAESELFGHRRGAFTGADHDRTGLIRAARGGVLFLDEIGDLEPGLQGKLLRVLQEHRVLALGEDHEVPVNVRVIAATNRNLDEMVDAKAFRADLFHRLNVLSIRLPTLRERVEDIEPLVRHFVALHASEASAPAVPISKEFIQALHRVNLPGNVRQLENVIRRAFVQRTHGEPLRLSDLPPEIWQQIANAKRVAASSGAQLSESSPPAGEPDVMSILAASSWKLAPALELCEHQILSAALNASSGNRSRAARLLGISARSIFNKMRKHRLTS